MEWSVFVEKYGLGEGGEGVGNDCVCIWISDQSVADRKIKLHPNKTKRRQIANILFFFLLFVCFPKIIFIFLKIH